MKALVLEEYNRLVYRNVADPEPKEIRVQGSCAIRGEYERVLEMLFSRRIRVDDQISVVAPLSEGAAWFSRLYNKEGGLSKVILKP
jgi:threonine dehydrogenase-like Zn-dependent dehydrogenase